MLNCFRGLPYALTESALIDGANHFQIMTKIIVPVSKPSLATVGLFTMVNHWNSWFDGMIYISDTAKYPLQTYLRNVIQSVDIASIDLTSVGHDKCVTENRDGGADFRGDYPYPSCLSAAPEVLHYRYDAGEREGVAAGGTGPKSGRSEKKLCTVF